MYKNKHHHYSIIANDLGFEYIFRTGQENWSTISPSFGKRLIQQNIDGKIGKRAADNASEFLKLACGNSDSWKSSKVFKYASRDAAISFEKSILDKAWAHEMSQSNE
jgi:hypothetical protein